MAIVPKNWHDYPTTDTPLTAASMVDLETRMGAYTDAASVGAQSAVAWGADPTGATNSTTGLNTAYAVAAATQGNLWIPPGDYATTGTGLNMNQNTRVNVIAYGARFHPAAASTAITVNPGVEGEAGLGATIQGMQIFNASTSTGIKVKSCNGFNFRDIRIDGGSIGVLISNDGASKYNEKHLFESVFCTSNTTGFKWEVINGGDPSMEGQTLVNCWVDANRCYSFGTGVNMESMGVYNCMAQMATASAVGIYTNCNMSGFHGQFMVESLAGSAAVGNAVIMQNDSATTNNHLTNITIHKLGSFAGSPYIKHASVALPTLVKEGPYWTMAGAVGGYPIRIRQDYEANDRFRVGPTGMDWGVGGGTGVDTFFGRLGANIAGSGAGDKLVGQAGLGCGNSAPATTNGSVQAKMEVFDETGASLGFVPIYASIT